MLKTLLALVAEGGAHSIQGLAARLDVSPEMVEAMLDDLTRLGYLRVLGGDCGGQCATCPLGGCAVAGTNHLWSLTEKGTRAATQVRRTFAPESSGFGA